MTDTSHPQYDVVIVGARVAGATLATRLASAGQRVALVDRATFPSDTLSTHVIFPDGLALLDEVGALTRLHERHELVPARYSWRVLGHEVAGSFTPVGGHDRCLSVRRVTLDAVLVEVAQEAGAHLVLGHRVTHLVGSGTPADPVTGVQLGDGASLLAPWVIGADGQHSSVARRLSLTREEERRGEVAMLLGYWRGLPPSEWVRLDFHEASGLMMAPCEDGLHLLTVAGPPELTRGRPAGLEARYRAALTHFPAVLNPRLLDAAELVSSVSAAPETMMRGYYRTAAGPGWALIGDAGHFKHPTTGQGIGDALAHAAYVAEQLLLGGDLSRFQQWRAERSMGPYEFSYRSARLPGPETAGRYAGLAADPVASQQFLDTFTHSASVSQVFTPERSRRWRAAAAYEDGLRRLLAIVDELNPASLDLTVPACPLWSVRDLVAHLAGVADDSLHGRFFPGAPQAWADPALAAAREEWTARQVEARRDATADQVVAELQRQGQALVRALRRGEPATCAVPDWMIASPMVDLAAHLDDLREAMGLPPEPEAPITRAGFGHFRAWLAQRLADSRLPPLRLSDGTTDWVLGHGEPATSLTADRYELFRAIAGRRSTEQVRSWAWSGDPKPYLPVLSPYPPNSAAARPTREEATRALTP